MGLTRDDLAQLEHLFRPLKNRIANMVARGVVKLANDAKKLQLLQVGARAGETVEGKEGAEHFQPFGFSSIPLAGAEAVVIFPNGDGEHPIVIAVSDRRYRPTGGQPGEVTVYNHTGAKVTITKDGDIIMRAASGRTIQADDGSGAATLALKSDVDALAHYISTQLTLPVSGATAGPTAAPAPPSASGTSVLKGK